MTVQDYYIASNAFPEPKPAKFTRYPEDVLSAETYTKLTSDSGAFLAYQTRNYWFFDADDNQTLLTTLDIFEEPYHLHIRPSRRSSYPLEVVRLNSGPVQRTWIRQPLIKDFVSHVVFLPANEILTLEGAIFKYLWHAHGNGKKVRQHMEEKKQFELVNTFYDSAKEPNSHDYSFCANCGVRRDKVEKADITWHATGFHCESHTKLCQLSFCSCFCRGQFLLDHNAWTSNEWALCPYLHEKTAWNMHAFRKCWVMEPPRWCDMECKYSVLGCICFDRNSRETWNDYNLK